ncbi:hypothetical protein RB195_020249 [Necator americanus]|uniref:Uncharacterized protein n=1 Tax=Necator americanus TaxID=51031 RepID=A0ABR1CJB9_NECAM
MDEATGASLQRRLSIESTATSEFEVVSRERSVSGSTVEGSSHSDNVSLADVSSPPTSLRIPALYTEPAQNEQEVIPGASIPKSTWSIDDDLRSMTNSISQMSESCVSDVSMMGRETMGILEQVYHELALMKGRNTLLERTVEQANEWRDKADRLEEQNRVLQKSLRTSKKKVQQFTQEMEEMKRREEKLASTMKESDERKTSSCTSSWSYRLITICVFFAVLAMYIDCYAQFLREHRSCEQLKEQLKLMDELVEKLEAEHTAEYKRRLEEISKQMADDMSANLAQAHKQRELEHERLIEAYREKMLLHDDLSALRKEKMRGRKKSATWFR